MIALDHVTLRTHALDETRDFLVNLLELRVGARPDFGFPGYWLYAGPRALIHLIPVRGDTGTPQRRDEGIDHAGFVIEDYEAMRTRLECLGVPYSTTRLPVRNERRLFVTTPTGILLELIARQASPGG